MNNLEELVKKEIEFCEHIGASKNEYGTYIYISADGKSRFNLPFVLAEFKEWLKENE